MSKILEPTGGTQVIIARADLAQFLYPIRVCMAEIARELRDINRKLDRLAPRRRARIVALRPSGTRQ
jgi:hypothetical protein